MDMTARGWHLAACGRRCTRQYVGSIFILILMEPEE
jgi:hypothetical protein